MQNIFLYTDYRSYLSDYYDEQKKKHAFFSYRYFSNRAGFKTKDFIYRVIKGERNLSRSSCRKVSQGIGHNGSEADYFENLVEFNQAKERGDREFYLEKLKLITRRVKKRGKAVTLKFEQYDIFAEWYHLVVRSIIDMYPFKENYDWLAKKVWPNISVTQARNSVELLERLEMIEKDENGFYHIKEKSLTTGDTVSKDAIIKYYQDTLGMAGNALESIRSDKRNSSGMTLGISQEGYKKIVDKLNRLRKEVGFIAREDNKANQVYNLQFHLFPVSKNGEDSV